MARSWAPRRLPKAWHAWRSAPGKQASHLPKRERLTPSRTGTRRSRAQCLRRSALSTRPFALSIVWLLLPRWRRRRDDARRQRPVAVVRRPVRYRQFRGRVEHRRVDGANLRLVDEEPLAEHVARCRRPGTTDEDGEGERG